MLWPVSRRGGFAEDRYGTRGAIEKSLQHDAGKFDDGAQRLGDATRNGLQAQMSAIQAEPNRGGFGPAKLNLDTLWATRAFALLDGLRFDAETGQMGEKARSSGSTANSISPRPTSSLRPSECSLRWLRAHKDWWDKGLKNVPQRSVHALKDELYTPGVSPTRR
jgi:hypothetical protein